MYLGNFCLHHYFTRALLLNFGGGLGGNLWVFENFEKFYMLILCIWTFVVFNIISTEHSFLYLVFVVVFFLFKDVIFEFVNFLKILFAYLLYLSICCFPHYFNIAFLGFLVFWGRVIGGHFWVFELFEKFYILIWCIWAFVVFNINSLEHSFFDFEG